MMKRVLYLGTDPTQFECSGHFEGHLIHFPVIKIVPKPLDDPFLKRAYDDLDEYTHCIFTSKNAVVVFAEHLKALQKDPKEIAKKEIIAIGAVTAAHLTIHGMPAQHVAAQEQQEGLIHLLNELDLDDAYLFLPRSSLARPLLTNYFLEREIRHQSCDLYDTHTQLFSEVPDLRQIDEIVFTSPSTVHAFLEIFKTLPSGKKLTAIGPITEQTLVLHSTQLSRRNGSKNF